MIRHGAVLHLNRENLCCWGEKSFVCRFVSYCNINFSYPHTCSQVWINLAHVEDWPCSSPHFYDSSDFIESAQRDANRTVGSPYFPYVLGARFGSRPSECCVGA